MSRIPEMLLKQQETVSTTLYKLKYYLPASMSQGPLTCLTSWGHVSMSHIHACRPQRPRVKALLNIGIKYSDSATYSCNAANNIAGILKTRESN